LAERPPEKRKVTGSTPVPTTKMTRVSALVIRRFRPVSVSRRGGYDSPLNPPSGHPFIAFSSRDAGGLAARCTNYLPGHESEDRKALMATRRRWRVWRTQRLLLVSLKVVLVALVVIISVVSADLSDLDIGRSRRRRVNVVNKLSEPPLRISHGGLLGRFDRWVDNQEIRGHLTVDPESDIFLWEAEEQDGSAGSVARVIERLTAVTVTDRWTYRFGRRLAVVVSLDNGTNLWLIGGTNDVVLRQLR
jgi:hypothetical protein